MAERPTNADLPPLRPRDGSGAFGRIGGFAENPAAGAGNAGAAEPVQPVQRPVTREYADFVRRRDGVPRETAASGGDRGEGGSPRRRIERGGDPNGPEDWWPETFSPEQWRDLAERPDYRAYLAMQHYQNMDWEARTPAVSRKFKKAGERLNRYAIERKHKTDSKGEPLDPQISEIQIELDFFDNAEIYKGTNNPDGTRVDTYSQRQKKRLQDAIDSLDEAETLDQTLNSVTIDPAGGNARMQELRGALRIPDLPERDKARIEDEIKILEEYMEKTKPYVQKAAEAKVKQKDKAQEQFNTARARIIEIAGEDFLNRRTAKKAEVEKRKSEKQVEIDAKKKTAAEGGVSLLNAIEGAVLENKYTDDGPIPVLEISDFVNPSPEIIDILDRMQKAAAEPDPAKREQISLWDLEELFDALPSFSEVSTELRNMRRASKTEDNINSINRLRRLTGWYIYHARENGLLEGLDLKLEKDEADFSKRVTMLGTGQESADTLGKIIDDFSLYTGKDGTRYAKTQGDLEAKCDRMDLPIEIVGKFGGIRELMLRRGYNRIRDKVNSLIRGGNNEMVIDNQGDSSDPFFYMGEWDLRKLNYSRERSQDTGRKEQFYVKSNFGYVQLTGASAEQIEEGALNYMNNLLESNNAYDLQQLLNEMKSLAAEIGRAGQERELSTDRIADIQDNVTNRALFRVIDFTGQILHMDVSFNAGLQWCDGRGDSRAKYIPQMENGMVGLAMHLLTKPEYMLYYRPEGWQGQMTNLQEGQRLLASKVQEQIVEDLMGYELSGDRKALSHCRSHDEFAAQFKLATFEIPGGSGEIVRVGVHGLRSEMSAAREAYDELFGNIAYAARSGQKVGLGALGNLKSVKERYESIKKIHDEAQSRAKNALSFAIEVENVFGESAERAAPSLQTKTGDRVALPIVTTALNYAVIMAAERTKADLRSKGLECTNYGQLIRQRAMIAVTDYVNEIHQSTVAGKEYTFKLQKGFEDTGLTEEEFAMVLDTYKEIFDKGFNAVVGGVRQRDGSIAGGKKLSEVVEMDELRPMTNNYLANDPHGKDVAFSEETMAQAAKGELPYFKSVYDRLRWFGLDEAVAIRAKEIDLGDLPKATGVTEREEEERVKTVRAAHENSRRAFVQVIENNRSLDSMLQKLTYYFATRKDINQVSNAIREVNSPQRRLEEVRPAEGVNVMSENSIKQIEEAVEHYMHSYSHSKTIFKSADAWTLNAYLDYTDYTDQNLVMELPGRSLGYKRYRNLKTRWITRDDEFSGRGIETVAWAPVMWQDINTASGSRDSLETIWNIDREILDIWQMQLHFERGKDVAAIKELMETGRTEKGEVNYRWLDKPLRDPEALNKLDHHARMILQSLIIKSENVEKSLGKEVKDNPIMAGDTSFIEGVVEPLQKIFRDEELLSLYVKLIDDDRGAIDSGAAWEECMKYRRRVHHLWLLSRKEGGSRREQGGLKGYERTAHLISAFLNLHTYFEEGSVEGRAWERSRPAVNRGVLAYSANRLPLAAVA